jgi:hypothetical protein
MTKAGGARQSAIEGRSLTLESVQQRPGQAGMRRATMMNRTARYVGVQYDAARCMNSATKIGKKHKL